MPDERNRFDNVTYNPGHLEEYNKPTLKIYCEEYGLSVDGTREDLLERLADSDATPWGPEDVWKNADGDDA